MTNVLITFLKPSLKGGGQRSTMLLLENLDRNRFNPVAVVPEEGEITKKCAEIEVAYELIALPALRPWAVCSIIRVLRRIKKIMKTHSIDIIHADSTRYSLYFGIIARILRKPLISHIRVSTPEPFFVEYLLYTLSSKIIAVSKATAQRFAKFRNFGEKVSVVYNAVDTEEFTLAKRQGILREKLGVGNSVILVGIIGEISPWKGQEDFIEAARIVLKQNKDVKFVIMGSGNEEYITILKTKVSEYGVDDYMFFLEYADNFPDIIADFDIIVNASKYIGKMGGEGFSRIIIEAMAAGVPVIVSKVGGNGEAVGDAGLLFPPGDIEKLAEHISVLASDNEKRKRIAIELRARCLRHFIKEIYVREIEKVYDEFLSEQSDDSPV